MRYFDLLTGSYYQEPDPPPSGRISRGSPFPRSSELDDIYSLLGDAQGIIDTATPVSTSSSELDQVYALLAEAQGIYNGALPTSQPNSDLTQVDQLLGQGQDLLTGFVPNTGGDSTLDLVNNLLGQATADYRAGMEIINRSPTISNSFGSSLLSGIGKQLNFINDPNTSIADLDRFIANSKKFNQILGNSLGVQSIYDSVNKSDRNLASTQLDSYGTFGNGYYYNPETGNTEWWKAATGFESDP